MRHVTRVKDLYEQTITTISQSEESWKDFLRCMGRLYQLDFLNTCMVYAQRPGATILAGYDEWLNMDLPVRRGSKGIAIFPSKLFGENVKYVFDVADTSGTGIRPWNWSVNGTNRRQLAGMLFPDIYQKEKKFKKSLNTFTRTYVWSMIKGEDGITKMLERLQSLTGAEASIEEMEITQFIVDSTLYAVESRCGITDREMDLSLISRYQNEEVLYRAGRLISHLSGRALFEISKSMKVIDLERREYYARDYRNSVQRSRRSSVSRIRGTDERSKSNGDAGQIRKDGSEGSAGGRSGTVRNDASDRNAPAENAGSGETGRGDARRSDREPAESMDERGQSRSLRHHEDDKPADTGRDRSREASDTRSDPSEQIIEEQHQKEDKTEVGTAEAVPFSLSDIQPGEISEELMQEILLEMTEDTQKRKIFEFYAHNPDNEDRIEYLHEIYGDDEIRKESQDSFLSYEGGRDGLYLLWTEDDSMYEAYWHWTNISERIDTLIKERNYLSLESISEFGIEDQENGQEAETGQEANEELPDRLEQLKKKVLDVGEGFYSQKISLDVLKMMLCRIYSTNRPAIEKAAFLKNILTEFGEKPQSYQMVHLEEETYEFRILESDVRISRLNDPQEEFTNVQFDWEEFADLTAHLVEEDRISYSEDLETIKQQQKMLQMLPWFLDLRDMYAAILEKEEQELPTGELQEMIDQGAFEVPANPYHDQIRRETVKEFVESSVAVVPYQALIYDFYQQDVSRRAKMEFVQCLLTEANKSRELAVAAGEVPINVLIEDGLVRISYADHEGNQYEQLLSYMEIADGIQEAIDRSSFLTPEEYELGKMDGYAFCGEEAVALFQEFSEKICSRPVPLPHHSSALLVSRTARASSRRSGLRHPHRHGRHSRPYQQRALYSRCQLYF